MSAYELDRISNSKVLDVDALLHQGSGDIRMLARLARVISLPVIAMLLVLFTTGYGHATDPNLVGMYVGGPGWITNSCSGYTSYLGWPTLWPSTTTNLLDPNPLYNSDARFYTDTTAYMDHMLDDAAAMGIDFLMVDESSGVVSGQGWPNPDYIQCSNFGANLTASLIALMDRADYRFNHGINTPYIAIFSPNPLSKREGSGYDDPDWIMTNIVRDPSNSGAYRPSYAWIGGKPLWGLWSYKNGSNPSTDTTSFLTTTTSGASTNFTVRYICDSDTTECTQAEVDTGTVWPWSTYNNATPGGGVTPTCPGDSSSSQSCPLSSNSSNEITIENGYENALNCLYYIPETGGTCPSPSSGVIKGFTPDYYNHQWAYAFQAKAKTGAPAQEIVLITSYDETEGGYIQASDAYEMTGYLNGDVYMQATAINAYSWKGNTYAISNTLAHP